MLEVKVINKSKFPLPEYATDGSAAMDVRANISETVHIRGGHTQVIPTGLYFEIPKGYCIKAYARSGLSIKIGLGLANAVGVIDSDYRGELKIALHNHKNMVKSIEAGERIAQIMVERVEPFKLVQVDSLESTERGKGGFGSTGRG